MSPFAVEALAESVCALTRDRARAAVFCDVDGTLGPVGVRSEAGPGDMVIRADLLADGADGFARVLEGLLRAAR